MVPGFIGRYGTVMPLGGDCGKQNVMSKNKAKLLQQLLELSLLQKSSDKKLDL